MLDLIQPSTIAIEVTGIEVVALKKLSLVSHALAEKIGGDAGREQAVLAKTLDDVIRRMEMASIR